MDGLSLAPVWFTDVIGSTVMIILSMACLWYAVRLRRIQPDNVLWTYLLALSLALAAFSVSRAVGHLAKRLLLLYGQEEMWRSLLPYTGAMNTLFFVVVGSVTLFFQSVYRINRVILNDKKALEQASTEVMRLNLDLRGLVESRTHQLSLTRDRYRTIFDGSMDMIFVVNEDGSFMDINQGGFATLGYEAADEIINTKSLQQVLWSLEDYEDLLKGLRSGGFVRDMECSLKSKEGAEILMLLSMTVSRSESEGPISYHGIAKDITARRKMERQLQRTDKLASLGQISAGIAHEINNPLGVILGYTQLIMRDQNQDGQEYEDLKTIERQARNCKRIVEDLLKFARATESHKAEVDVNQCIRDLVSLLSHHFELDGIEVRADLNQDLPLVSGDSEKIKQVFMNLLMNARQAISRQGLITIATRTNEQSDQILVCISDNGCGMPSEITDKIFDPFFTTKPVGEGTGLGLSVSYGIIQDHGGTLSVASEEGKGSDFTITLPSHGSDKRLEH